MRHAQYWTFQGSNWSSNDKACAKIAQQEIAELTNLASGLLAFEKTYTHTHGERTPVFRLLSMINEKIAENISLIENFLVNGSDKEVPFFVTLDSSQNTETE